MRREGEFLFHAEGCFLEGQLHVDGQVVSAGRSTLLRRPKGTTSERPSAEGAAEEILEKVAETGEAVEVEAAGAAGAAAEPLMPVGVVDARASGGRRAPRRLRWPP